MFENYKQFVLFYICYRNLSGMTEADNQIANKFVYFRERLESYVLNFTMQYIYGSYIHQTIKDLIC